MLPLRVAPGRSGSLRESVAPVQTGITDDHHHTIVIPSSTHHAIPIGVNESRSLKIETYHRYHYTPRSYQPTMIDDRELAIHPVVQESVQHNARVRIYCCVSIMSLYLSLTPNSQVLSNLRSLTASLFGVAAGILGLESYPGFMFYLFGTLVVSLLVYFTLAEARPTRYFQSQLSDLWGAELLGGLSSFVLTWTLFYGLVRA